MPEVMTEKDVAEMLKMSKFTLADLRRKGNGPPHFIAGSSIRYLKESVDNWIKQKEGE